MKTIILVAMLFIALDFVTGIAQAVHNKTFASSKMREGLWHKACELIVILLAGLCEWAFPQIGLEVQIPFVPVTITYIVVMELASIVENIASIHPGLAAILNQILGPYTGDKKEGKKENHG